MEPFKQPRYDTVWLPGLPNDPGEYWVYGYIWPTKAQNDKRELRQLSVRRTGNGSIIYLIGGVMIYKSEVGELAHSLAYLPNLPV